MIIAMDYMFFSTDVRLHEQVERSADMTWPSLKDASQTPLGAAQKPL